MKKDELFLKRVASEIRNELDRIAQLMGEYHDFLDKYSKHMDVYLLRVKASYLADFYMGVEKIFEIVIEELNGGAPKGDAWHKRLLHAMTLEMKGTRPPVVTNALYQDLLKFLGFRHVVRQAYGFQLDEKKLAELEGIFDGTWRRFSREIKKFCDLLEGKKK
jgi:hypothetical protein